MGRENFHGIEFLLKYPFYSHPIGNNAILIFIKINTADYEDRTRNKKLIETKSTQLFNQIKT